MNEIARYSIGTVGIVMNLAVGIPSLIAGYISSGGSYLTLFALYNIPQVPGYILISIGFGKYVTLGDIAFQNILFPLFLRYCPTPPFPSPWTF
jgi:hypothetical protein